MWIDGLGTLEVHDHGKNAAVHTGSEVFYAAHDPDLSTGALHESEQARHESGCHASGIVKVDRWCYVEVFS